jgi:hypothetical protein
MVESSDLNFFVRQSAHIYMPFSILDTRFDIASSGKRIRRTVIQTMKCECTRDNCYALPGSTQSSDVSCAERACENLIGGIALQVYVY